MLTVFDDPPRNMHLLPLLAGPWQPCLGSVLRELSCEGADNALKEVGRARNEAGKSKQILANTVCLIACRSGVKRTSQDLMPPIWHSRLNQCSLGLALPPRGVTCFAGRA